MKENRRFWLAVVEGKSLMSRMCLDLMLGHNCCACRYFLNTNTLENKIGVKKDIYGEISFLHKLITIA